jgi:GntR family transcriptional regulator
VDFLSDESHILPLYQELAGKINIWIQQHHLLHGEKVPSERKFAEIFGSSRMTAKRAIDYLVESNVLYRVHGGGTYLAGVARENYKFAFTKSNSMSDALHFSGKEVSTNVLRKIENCESSFLNAKLALPENERVMGLHRLRFANETPFAVEYTYVPSKLFPDMLKVDFRNVGLYDFMSSQGHKPVHFQQYITVIHPQNPELRLLNIDNSNQYIYKLNFTSTDSDGTILEYTESYINPQGIDISYEFEL